LDIDYFKSFNDTYGHLIGDEVLILLAQHINTIVRDTDTFARWGGEEFVILLPNTSLENSINLLNKIRESISQIEHKIAGSITASFGVTSYQDGDDIESLFKRCDDALYDAKESGRNKVASK
jgi:diguanylate cyclase (GGDEF)-like protein